MPDSRRKPFSILIKPSGPACNLRCQYCFYLEKDQLYPSTSRFRMSEETLEELIRQYCESQPGPEINFAWQGGEPTLMGIDFFRKAVALQKKYAGGRTITNAIQTNGTLLNDDWGSFFSENRFLIGLSIDGPSRLHDRYRMDRRGGPTLDRVLRGLEVLQRHRVEYNTLTVVNRHNVRHPRKLYRFLTGLGSRHLQFIPLVERVNTNPDSPLTFAGPPPSCGADTNGGDRPSPECMPAEAYGEFLVEIFDTWIRNDVGRVFIQFFETSIASWLGMPASLCVFAETCGDAVVVEHNGDVYACDHYVYPEFRLGNLGERPMPDLVGSEQQLAFGNAKRDTLPQVCRECRWLFACRGECPKHRFAKAPDGSHTLNYLCPAYKRFYSHADPYLRIIADLIASRQPAERIMDWIAWRENRPPSKNRPGRNDPCPCGSGKKYKHCCK